MRVGKFNSWYRTLEFGPLCVAGAMTHGAATGLGLFAHHNTMRLSYRPDFALSQ